MKRRHQGTLSLIFARPASGNVKWRDVESLLVALGGTLEEAEGSRVTIRLFGTVRVFHRPHPSPDTDKGAVASVRQWLENNGVTP
ncbi:MAG TPA: type II toxin-antitoxin system HicA family toxin [Patescibacteria group bacterium]|nr:type II toxin-antitoxin system HicA family toxin [Patescibacteria group bacterium]